MDQYQFQNKLQDKDWVSIKNHYYIDRSMTIVIQTKQQWKSWLQKQGCANVKFLVGLKTEERLLKKENVREHHNLTLLLNKCNVDRLGTLSECMD